MAKRRRPVEAVSPAVPERARGVEGRTRQPGSVGHESILLVEDDTPIRQLFRWTLKGLEYDLMEACNGKEALSVLGRHKGRLDLLLTDVVMPHMDGFDLAERVAAAHPEAKILFVTAYAADSIAVRGGLVEAGYGFLLKPFAADRLAAKVRELLDRPAEVVAGAELAPVGERSCAPRAAPCAARRRVGRLGQTPSPGRVAPW